MVESKVPETLRQAQPNEIEEVFRDRLIEIIHDAFSRQGGGAGTDKRLD